jgi:hypothetical protein
MLASSEREGSQAKKRLFSRLQSGSSAEII